jgi:hypothetical protein
MGNAALASIVLETEAVVPLSHARTLHPLRSAICLLYFLLEVKKSIPRTAPVAHTQRRNPIPSN